MRKKSSFTHSSRRSEYLTDQQSDSVDSVGIDLVKCGTAESDSGVTWEGDMFAITES